MAQAPPPSLSLRQLDRGGEILDPPLPNPANILRLRWHLVLLIHGYNNDLNAGREAFEGFRRTQRELAGLALDAPIAEGEIVDVYWPGDADWGLVSALYYPWSIEKARRSASVLAETLARAARESGWKTIDIISHSMGCRLTIELLRNLLDFPQVFVRRVVFMAAAIPTFKLEPDDPSHLREAYDAKLQERAMSLFSPGDLVLAGAFPLGQTLGGEGEGILPVALGHDQWVSRAVPFNMTQHLICGAGHSDYWGWNEKTIEQAKDANTLVHDLLYFKGTIAREVCSRATPERSGAEERDWRYD